MAVNTIGYHYIVEAAGCDPEILGSPPKMRDALEEAARVGNMELKTSYLFRFAPAGVSGVVIVAESHISIHTWPEKQYAALDVYVCGDNAEPERAIEFILEQIGAGHAHISELKRGIEDEGVYSHSMMSWEETLDSDVDGDQ